MIELKDFVSKALTQIVEGVQEAQTALKGSGAEINPYMVDMQHSNTKDLCIRMGSKVRVPIIMMKFDVAVQATEGMGTKGGIGIIVGSVSLGTQGRTDKESSSTSRISFEIPVALPQHPDIT